MIKKYIKRHPFLKKICLKGWNINKKLLSCTFPLFNILYSYFLTQFFEKEIYHLAADKQVFLIVRGDLGVISLNLHYAGLWNRKRGKACILIVSPNPTLVKKLAAIICPEIKLICHEGIFARFMYLTFSSSKIYVHTYSKAYAYILTLRPNANVILDHQNLVFRKDFTVKYNRFFDENFEALKRKSKEFQNNYFFFNEHFNFRKDGWEDYNHLYETSPPLPPTNRGGNKELKELLGITNPYIVINFNIKYYGNRTDPAENRRRIFFPDRLEIMIDRIIASGYDVVLTGRGEQPNFKKRKHFINYAFSPYTSIENDLSLISHASGMIASKTGPEVFAMMYHIPLLGLNYTEPGMMLRPMKYRFVFKKWWDSEKKKYLCWDEIFKHPTFFDYGAFTLARNIEYHELSEEELLNAVEEFLPLIDKPLEKWLEYSPLQKSFKESIDPTHLDLYHCKGVPCTSSLGAEIGITGN